MFQRSAFRAFGVLALTYAFGAQAPSSKDLTTFHARLDEYTEMHRRLEGPLHPVAVTTNMDDVHRSMDALRVRIRAERKGQEQGYLFSPGLIEELHERLAAVMTPDEIRNAMEDIDEHMPLNMPPVRVNEALPEEAPFGMVPPQALRNLPPLPDELRYMVLSKALLLWDHHADLVVDIAPGLFDPASYTKAATRK